MINNTQSGDKKPSSGDDTSETTSHQTFHSEKQSQLFENLVDAFFLCSLDIDNDSNHQNLIDAHYFLTSSMAGQLDVFYALAGALPAKEEVQIQAGSLLGSTESLSRLVAAMEVITDGLSSVISDLRRDNEKQCEAYELQLSVLRKAVINNQDDSVTKNDLDSDIEVLRTWVSERIDSQEWLKEVQGDHVESEVNSIIDNIDCLKAHQITLEQVNSFRKILANLDPIGEENWEVGS